MKDDIEYLKELGFIKTGSVYRLNDMLKTWLTMKESTWVFSFGHFRLNHDIGSLRSHLIESLRIAHKKIIRNVRDDIDLLADIAVLLKN